MEDVNKELLFKEFDELMARHGIGLDSFLELLACAQDDDAEKQEHEGVKALLNSAAEGLRIAAFEIYASYK